jgi:endonuclease/exonuclease/phosphatase family metal-dependent hydrolase
VGVDQHPPAGGAYADETPWSDAEESPLLEPPGLLLANYGRGSAVVTLVGHLPYGAIVGALARRPLMLVRSWNVFHGNAVPPQRRSFLAEMVRLASDDRPEVLCLQELPVWSLPRLEGWSGMTAVADVAAPPLLPAVLARAITGLHQGLFRSAVTGQANAILLAPSLRVLEHRVARLPSPEPRVCQAVRLERDIVVANLHASGDRAATCAAELDAA